MRRSLVAIALLAGSVAYAQTPPPAPARSGMAITVTNPRGATLPGVRVDVLGASDRNGDTNERRVDELHRDAGRRVPYPIQWRTGAGSFVSIPRGTAHALVRRGRRPLIVFATLSGAPCEEPR